MSRQLDDAKKGIVHGTSVLELPKQQLCWAGQACWPLSAGVSSHAVVALHRVIKVRDLFYFILLYSLEGTQCRTSWGSREPGSSTGQAGHAGLSGQRWHCTLLGRCVAAALGNCASRSHSHGGCYDESRSLKASGIRVVFLNTYMCLL